MRKTIVGLAVAALVAIGCASAPDADTSTVAPAEAPATNPAPPAKPAAKGLTSGTWEVGTEVKPGTYTTTATDHCYWARLKDFDGDLDAIIANGNLKDGERGRITVKKTDKGLELTGDCVWTRRG